MKKQSRKNKEHMEKRRRKAFAKNIKRKNKLRVAKRTALNTKSDAKRRLEEAVATKMNMFNQMPDNCNLCKKGFDKTNREMVESWKVVVKPPKIELYCLQCQAIIEDKVSEKEKEDGLSGSANDV